MISTLTTNDMHIIISTIYHHQIVSIIPRILHKGINQAIPSQMNTIDECMVIITRV